MSKKDNTPQVLKLIGALLIVLAWVLGWLGEGVGLTLFIGGGLLILVSNFFN